MLFPLIELAQTKMISRVQRKSRRARELIQQRNWHEVVKRAGENLDPVAVPVSHTAALVRDIVTHTYWKGQERLGLTPFNSVQPFSIVSETGMRRKNVIWVMLDALRQDLFQEYLRRGGLAALNANAVNFARAFAQGSWTYASVFSFLTGLYPFNCGVSRITARDGQVVSVCGDFQESAQTIFDILNRHGYTVGSILDGWGFTIRETAGQVHREDHYFEEHWGWRYGQGRRYIPLPELCDASLAFTEDASSRGPFMLFVRTLYTHSPYRGIFQDADTVIDWSANGSVFRLVEGFVRGLEQFETIYLAPLLKGLEEQGQLQDTILILHSDHGEMLWNLEEDLRRDNTDKEAWRHQLEPYNALIKVPLWIWNSQLRGVYPGRFRLMDLVPTLLDELGISYQANAFDGVSARAAAPRPIYADAAGYGHGGIALQPNGTKYMISKRLGAVEYGIGEDEYERVELRRHSDRVINELTTFLQAHRRQEDELTADNEEILLKRLQALGYVE